MAYHADHSSEFVGLRSALGGRKQVVYDVRRGKRILLEICDPTANDEEIHAALKEGISSRNVFGGVLTALKARNIEFDFV